MEGIEIMYQNHDKHKRKIGNRPNSNCLLCWREWFKEKPNEVITSKDMERILDAIGIGVLLYKVNEMWKMDLR